MKQFYLLIFLLTGCNGFEEQTENQEEGFPIAHAQHYNTKVKDFGDFYLHSWFSDTIYSNCGQEFYIRPKDSTLTVNVEAKNTQIYLLTKDKNGFAVEASDQDIELIFNLSNGKSITHKLTSVKLPDPVTTSLILDSTTVKISVDQENKRIKEILPYDCRYQVDKAELQLLLNGGKKLDTLINTHQLSLSGKSIVNIDIKNAEIYRISFRNKKIRI